MPETINLEGVPITPGAGDFCAPCPLRLKEGEATIPPTLPPCDSNQMVASAVERLPTRRSPGYTLYEDRASICALRQVYAPGTGRVPKAGAPRL